MQIIRKHNVYNIHKVNAYLIANDQNLVIKFQTVLQFPKYNNIIPKRKLKKINIFKNSQKPNITCNKYSNDMNAYLIKRDK